MCSKVLGGGVAVLSLVVAVEFFDFP